jgi:hypothetical protein
MERRGFEARSRTNFHIGDFAILVDNDKRTFKFAKILSVDAEIRL